MKTNLIFKRQVTVEGETKVVTRIVPVNIPDINSGEGWTLSGHTDSLEVCEGVYAHHVAPTVPEDSSISVTSNDTYQAATANSIKFESSVMGTAKLVRSRGVIKIVSRRGKTTYNQNTPNSVCINDFTKNEFFKNCREVHGNSGVFEFRIKDGRPYDYWNDVIDKEYARQKRVYESTTYVN